MIELFCPSCHSKLQASNKDYKCNACTFVFQNNSEVLSNNSLLNSDKQFYDHIYEGEHGEKWVSGLKENFAKKLLEKISLSYRRERFFKGNMKGKNNLILDLACGAGRHYFKNFGTVVGIDLSFKPLEAAKNKYDLVIQSGCESLPFADETFDYVVSSDFFGHVRNGDKDKIISEIYRILKKGGKTLHIIETDSKNLWFRIAHKKPELFQKYFVEKIGGHVGLEMPSACVERWENNGFKLEKAEKIWGLIWPIEYYNDLFGNEYADASRPLKLFISFSKMVTKVKVVRILVNILLNPINYLVELFTPLDNGNGLMLICKK